MIYTDRSRYETGQRCDRERYWNYAYEASPELLDAEDVVQSVPGVVPVRDSLDLLFGSAVHEHVEVAQKRKNPVYDADTPALIAFVNAEVDAKTPDGINVKEEYRALYNGLIQVFDTYTLPLLQRDYDFMGAEVESSTLLSENLTWMSRIDGALRRKSDGLWFTLEIKTSSYPEQLLMEASTNFQLLMEVESMRRHFGLKAEQIGGALLLVFNKGRKSRASEGERKQGKDGYRRLSPFTYWYAKDTAAGNTQYQLAYKSGWDRRAVWTIPGALETAFTSWGDTLQSEVQLLSSASFDAKRTESVIRQVVAQENNYALYEASEHSFSREEALDWHFPQNFKMCNNSGGFKRPCAYKGPCFSPNVASNPFQAGFESRTPNHPQEGEQVNTDKRIHSDEEKPFND